MSTGCPYPYYGQNCDILIANGENFHSFYIAWRVLGFISLILLVLLDAYILVSLKKNGIKWNLARIDCKLFCTNAMVAALAFPRAYDYMGMGGIVPIRVNAGLLFLACSTLSLTAGTVAQGFIAVCHHSFPENKDATETARWWLTRMQVCILSKVVFDIFLMILVLARVVPPDLGFAIWGILSIPMYWANHTVVVYVTRLFIKALTTADAAMNSASAAKRAHRFMKGFCIVAYIMFAQIIGFSIVYFVKRPSFDITTEWMIPERYGPGVCVLFAIAMDTPSIGLLVFPCVYFCLMKLALPQEVGSWLVSYTYGKIEAVTQSRRSTSQHSIAL